MKYNTNSQFKYLRKPALILGISFSLLLFIIFFGINKIKVLNQKISAVKILNNQLNQKIEILKDVQDKVNLGVNYADIALPSSNVSLFALSQIRKKATSLGLTIDSLKVANPIVEASGIEKTSIAFDITGDEVVLDIFLNSLEKMLPLSNINKLSVNSDNGISQISVTLNFYSTEILKKIPAVSSQINSLTAEELDILNNLSNYEVPAFGLPQVNEFPVRDDLFN